MPRNAAVTYRHMRLASATTPFRILRSCLVCSAGRLIPRPAKYAIPPSRIEYQNASRHVRRGDLSDPSRLSRREERSKTKKRVKHGGSQIARQPAVTLKSLRWTWRRAASDWRTWILICLAEELIDENLMERRTFSNSVFNFVEINR